MKLASRLAIFALLVPLWVYRMTLSRVMPLCCRFEPSCSAYAWEAITRHGPVRGLRLTVWRVLRCQPLCECGYDPVPD